MKRKVVVVWISLVMIFGFVVIVVEIAPNVRAATTRYVGGSGAGNHSKIQSGINVANPGDTVYVYNGTYYEHPVIEKSIYLIGEDRNTTIIEGSGVGDVVYVYADGVTVSGFLINNSGNSGHPVYDSGIKYRNSQNGFITGNIVSNCAYGIFLEDSNGIHISKNEAIYNDYGIYFYWANDNSIINNDALFSVSRGIDIVTSHYNEIINNNASSNGDIGISLYNSNHVKIMNNTAYMNDDHGIRILYSGWDNIINNTMVNCGIFIAGTILDDWNTHNIDTSNTVNGKPVYYWKNLTSGKIPASAGEVILANCSNVIIENQELTNSSIGINLGFSSNNTITENNVSSHSRYGIYLKNSNDNDIKGNNVFNYNMDSIYLYDSNRNDILCNEVSYNIEGIRCSLSNENNIINNIISNNEEGIVLSSSIDNNIYYNSFLINTIQAIDNNGNENKWDNGYPFGGNYWSNYSGVDNFNGPDQDIPGSDGIGDTNYSIDSDSVDFYPLMAPYKSLGNYTTLKQGWNLISIPIIQEEQNLIRVLGSIDGWYDAVQLYDITDTKDLWKHRKVGKPYGNDLLELNETMGFWIHITSPGDTIFFYNGTRPTKNQTITLHSGWNMVGYPSLSYHNRTVGLNNLTFGDHVDAIWSYDSATQRWEKMGESDYFKTGRGYYIHAKTKCEWEVPL
ncbi:MAG: right-handed parallel beta-helix repeat-containing protein [Thermoplasmata archaeon]|nr:MAG: right-handed parallel beta-helix repeat-containing protein [Thermoplasmata archaeon]